MPNSIGYTIITQAGHGCPYCDKSATLLEERGLDYATRTLPKRELREEAARAQMKTVPIIYHGEKLVGGYTALAAYLA